MSYSRWIASNWYTFWCYQDKTTENRDTASFEVCGVSQFTAKQLRDDLQGCMARAHELDPAGDIDELMGYAREFLCDVDSEYGDADTKAAGSDRSSPGNDDIRATLRLEIMDPLLMTTDRERESLRWLCEMDKERVGLRKLLVRALPDMNHSEKCEMSTRTHDPECTCVIAEVRKAIRDDHS